MSEQINLSENLNKLKAIADWFDVQDNLDVELGLQKVKEAAVLIKESRERLAEVQNQFTDVKKEIEYEPQTSNTNQDAEETEAINF